jgi:hypothetical protein
MKINSDHFFYRSRAQNSFFYEPDYFTFDPVSNGRNSPRLFILLSKNNQTIFNLTPKI